jgi:hypothetical protein
MQVVGKPLLWLVERAIDLERVGFLSGQMQVVDLFGCVVVRLLQILPSPDVVLAMLRQDIHKYLRMVAAVVIRLIGNADMLKEAIAICFEDFRNIRIRQVDSSLAIVPLDQLCETLFFEPTEDQEQNNRDWIWLGLKVTRRVV